MRNLLTAMIAFVLSTFAAGMAAVMVAERIGAQEEFILVFMAIAPLGLIVGLPMLIASFRSEPRLAISRMARWLAAVFVLLFAGLFGYAFFMAQTGGAVMNDLPILASIAMPAAIILFLQWLVFRLRARPGVPPASMTFGRNGA